MKEYIKIAWRNLWRNRKRTAITSASIFFAVFFTILMRSMELGSYDNMIKNAVEKYSGFIQIQNLEYQDDPGIDNCLTYSTDMIENLDKLKGIKAVVPRVESFALASFKNQTKGVAIVGIDLNREKKLSDPNSLLVKYRITPENVGNIKKSGKLPQNIIQQIENLAGNSYSNEAGIKLDLDIDDAEFTKNIPEIEKELTFKGNPLTQDDNGVLVSDRLSKYLKVVIGDTLILMGQGYHGVSAAGLFPIRGIIKIPAPDLDNKLVYTSLKTAEEFFSLQNQATSIAINLDNNDNANLIKKQKEISQVLNDSALNIRNWKEFNKVLFQQIESDSQSGILMLCFLYIIIFFGIFGTVLMMIHERYKELGVLISIGMQRVKLGIILIIELFFMGIMGLVSGILMSLPLLYLGNRYPIRLGGDLGTAIESYGMEPVMPLAWIDTYILWQVVIVAIMIILVSIYPFTKVMKLKEVEALRS
jgi:ABC-type lipoprotein release transport system permease subunit